MNDIDSVANKDFTDGDNTKHQTLKEVATVSVCLCDKHDVCTGSYIDYTKTYVVRCSCSCHNYKSVATLGDK
jgi:hypothetical protein